MTPGTCDNTNHHDERHGVCCLLVAVEPLRGVRCVQVRSHRTNIDDAEFMQALVELPCDANVKGIRLVQDNLNPHEAGSFYQAFDPEAARQLTRHVAYHYTPTNGSWLNMAEIELSALVRQCLDRRIATQDQLEHEVLACVNERNEKQVPILWRFTTREAREKLKRHYTTIKN